MSLPQLQRLLPLPEADLQQVLDYASTLTKLEAADHFNNLLGESPQSIEFISSFNSRRQDPKYISVSSQSSAPSDVPRHVRKQPKKKAPLHQLPPRQLQDGYSARGTAYKKKSEDDYMVKKPAINIAVAQAPAPILAPSLRPPPSAAGPLISGLKSKSASISAPSSTPTSRNSSPAPKNQTKTKISITGGTPMHGASTALSVLDAAIRSLELQTNPSSSMNNPSASDNEKRKCNCIATRHSLLAAAPNCLNCGKVICVKEGLGPCTFCGEPLLSASEIQSLLRELKEERGKEKMALEASSHRRAEVSKTPAPFSNPRTGGPTPGEASLGLSAADIAAQKAKEHRDRLLGFQAQNAKRTTVRDEAGDFETPETGTSMWSSPAERARQLKQQMKMLRDQEWNARPEWEKRRQVVSIDLVKGKVVKRMGAVERAKELDEPFSFDEDEAEDDHVFEEVSGTSSGHGRGTFAQNPLLGGLIKPVWNSGKGKEVDASSGNGERKKTWRRVQDEYEDNEGIILDGGAQGGTLEG